MQHAIHLKRIVPSISLLASLIASGALAQSPTSSDGATSLDEVVITAQKREQNVNDVGMSISAISGEALAARGITDVADLTKVVPGFTYTQTQFDMPVYSLRGVGYYESSLAANPAVTVYVDEVPLPYPAMTRGALLDVQRIEVLKGPQGTLFGQNSTGGGINYVAARPTSSPAAGFTIDYGRFDTLRVEGYASGPLAPGLRGRLALSTVQGGPWQQSLTRNDSLGRTNEVVGRLLLDWDATENLKLAFNLNGWRDKSESQAPQHRGVFAAVPSVPLDPGFVAAPLAPDDARAADWDPSRNYARNTAFYQGSIRGDWRLTPSLTATAISAYARTDRSQFAETDGTPVEDLSLGTSGQITSFSQELRIAGEGEWLRHWVVGANFQSDRIVDIQHVFLDKSTSAVVDLTGFGLPLFHFADFFNRSRNRVESWAIFASGEAPLTETLSLEGGLRYSRNRNRFTSCSADSGTGELAAAFAGLQTLGGFLGALPTTTPVAGGCVTLTDANFNVGDFSSTLDEDNLSWRVNLNWRPTEDVLVYGAVSRGYKAGNFPTLSASSTAQFQPVTQEELTAYEIGTKAYLPAARMQLNGAIFYYDYQNKQLRGRVTDPIFGQLEALVNIPESHIWGVEGQLIWRPIDSLTVNVGATYIQTEIDGTFVNFSQFGGPPQSFSGNEFPYSPKAQVNADFDYRRPITDDLTGFAGVDITYRSESKGGLEDDTRLAIDGYALVDLRAGVQSETGRWKLTVWGRNVGDVYYWNNVLKAQDNVIRYAGRPATYGLTITHEF
ncbi:MAG: TonB-dependent receptor [Caulobacter sp.]|nr:TonB-dependent receptor [Caulobacter sp.]